MPLSIMTVGVNKIGEVAQIAVTVGTLDCVSPHVSHTPHMRLLVGLGLG